MTPHDEPVSSRAARADAPPAVDAQAPLVAPAAPTTSPPHAPSDRQSAIRILAWTVGAGLLASGLIEYHGWQIIFRMAPSLPATIPLGEHVLGTLKTLGGALGVGAGFGLVGLSVPKLRRRPWRTLAAGVAVGTASLLGFMAWLVSLAP